VSAFSPVLTGWTRGGPVGIHGTNEPASIGLAASNGCIRVDNTRIVRLLHDVQAGTPVVIHP
jgi:lipoprotein-anchoring transpeptidase ErfK/SrfK